ncbi:MAG TPA: MtrB/PioB family outer membrane beta-barrel protein [Vicinamibacterales bacterium]|nr:MtrB/PioB family outer membrane beta-barrel protein [Vicinamibacterales bacterium]
MRTRQLMLVAALLLVSGGAMAQDKALSPAPQDAALAPAPAPAEFGGAVNQIEFGYRGTVYTVDSDEARRQRYQDLRNGATVDRFRWGKTTDQYLFRLEADHLGYRDQRVAGSYNNYGKVRANFEWNQIPLYFSQTTQSIYSTSGGTAAISDSLQLALQNKAVSLVDAAQVGSVFDLHSRRYVANANLIYNATRNVDVTIWLRNTDRQGQQPWAGSFGIGGSPATVELAVPIDHRTTDLGTALEIANSHAFAKIGYEGSFFRNNVPTFTWDNPVRVTDAPNVNGSSAPGMGRESLWPNSDMNSAIVSGGVNFAGHSRATGFLSVGRMSQNDALLPMTVNAQLPVVPLERRTAEAEARTVAMYYNVTSRPTSTLWFSARYRQYELDNRTPVFETGAYVNYDTAYTATLNHESEPFGYTRHTFDADASYSPVRYLGLRAGYTRAQNDRTYRIVERTTEDIGRFSIDLTGVSWLTLRGVYEHGQLRGSPVDEAELIAIGEQPSLRQFDISDRDRDRVSAIVYVTPASFLSFSGTAGVGRENYPGTNFGLRSNDNHVYSVGVNYVPGEKVNLGIEYGWEKYDALQASRTANPAPDPTFTDPRRDWTDDSADTVKTWTVSLDLLRVMPKTELRIAYDVSDARSTYVYGLAPSTTLAPPAQLPAVTNALRRGTVDGKYFLTPHFAVGGIYWYDAYQTSDFALGPQPGLALPATASPGIVMIGYRYLPYTANTIAARITYLW